MKSKQNMSKYTLDRSNIESCVKLIGVCAKMSGTTGPSSLSEKHWFEHLLFFETTNHKLQKKETYLTTSSFEMSKASCKRGKFVASGVPFLGRMMLAPPPASCTDSECITYINLNCQRLSMLVSCVWSCFQTLNHELSKYRVFYINWLPSSQNTNQHLISVSPIIDPNIKVSYSELVWSCGNQHTDPKKNVGMSCHLLPYRWDV